MVNEEEQAVTLRTRIEAEFLFPTEATTKEQREHREILNKLAKKATERLQPIFRALITEILDAQSKFYIDVKPEG